MQPNGWIYKIILLFRKSLSSTAQQLLPMHLSKPIPPLTEVTPGFQKGRKKETHFQNG
jgi:hypothetical protein